jgi:hypothetical protein
VRKINPRSLLVERVGEQSTHKPAVAVHKTKTDDKHGWIAAGQGMARLLLQAQAT